jgi:two-component system chemotaxis response regulator CheY
MRLLIVDDSKTMRGILGSYARSLECEVEEAEDGLCALEKLRTCPDYDAVLIDWDMPRMNGLELLRAIRAEPACDGIKTMIVTSQSSMERVTQALVLGADVYLMKPLDSDMLADEFRLLALVV